MPRFVFSTQELDLVRQLLTELKHRYNSAEDDQLLAEVIVFSQELPRRLRQFAQDFRQQEPQEGVCLVEGYPLDVKSLGKTPSHWNLRQQSPLVVLHEMYFILLASLFGDVFGWMSQQNGYIIHDILPIKGHESEEISSCSEGGLSLHTEDAFHPFRADYVGLMCLRNPGPIATTVASLDVSLLSRKQIEILRQPFFTIRPDLSHGRFTKDDTENESPRRAGCSECSTPYSYVPERVAVLFGDSQSPYMCLDPFFMDPSEHNDAALSALRALTESLERNTVDIYLGAGECCFIDNYRVLHGRRPFTPTYDVNERWLKRVNITRDLRKSRAMRQAVNSRIIY